MTGDARRRFARPLFFGIVALASVACIEESTGRSPGNIGDNPRPPGTSSSKDASSDGADATGDTGARIDATPDAPASDAGGDT